MTEREKMKTEMLCAYMEVAHLSEKARNLNNAGVVAYLKCAASFIDAALETLKAEDTKDEQ